MLVPMTLSGLERRDAIGHYFFRLISVIMLVSFDLERPHLARYNTCRRSIFLRNQPRPNPKGAGPQRPPCFWTRICTPFRFDEFGMVTCGEGRVSIWSGTISIPREWGSSTPNFFGSTYNTRQPNFAS